jgi:hypothetical protein
MDVLPNLCDPGLELAARLHSRAADKDSLHEHGDARRLREQAMEILARRDMPEPAVDTAAEDLTSSVRPFDPAEFAQPRRLTAWQAIAIGTVLCLGMWVAAGLTVLVLR